MVTSKDSSRLRDYAQCSPVIGCRSFHSRLRPNGKPITVGEPNRIITPYDSINKPKSPKIFLLYSKRFSNISQKSLFLLNFTVLRKTDSLTFLLQHQTTLPDKRWLNPPRLSLEVIPSTIQTLRIICTLYLQFIQ